MSRAQAANRNQRKSAQKSHNKHAARGLDVKPKWLSQIIFVDLILPKICRTNSGKCISPKPTGFRVVVPLALVTVVSYMDNYFREKGLETRKDEVV